MADEVKLINPVGRVVTVPAWHPAIKKARDKEGGWEFAEKPEPVKRGPGRPRKVEFETE